MNSLRISSLRSKLSLDLAIEIEWKTAPAAEAKKLSERTKVTLSRIGRSVSESKGIRLLVANICGT